MGPCFLSEFDHTNNKPRIIAKIDKLVYVDYITTWHYYYYYYTIYYITIITVY